MRRFLLALASLAWVLAGAVQIKDIANTVGVRDNQIIGYGLVVGLNGSGDGTSSKFTLQSVSNLLQGMNIKVDPADIKSKNTAAVMVTAKLPPFAKSGDKLDVTVSSLGDAKSLQGGTLLLTALRGIDGEIYAIAQGSISIGGLSARPGGAGTHSTAATVMAGANVEREIPQDFENNDLTLSLKNADFKTAQDVQNALNTAFDQEVAQAVDSRTIKLTRPDGYSSVEFMASVLEQDINYAPKNKVIIDERTGTVIAGVNVEVAPVLITHGAITIKIDPSAATSTPTPAAQNAVAQAGAEQTPAAAPAGQIDMGDGGIIDPATNTLKINNPKSTVANIARMLNKLGATPNDIIAIMQNLKRSGAINADLEVI